MVTYSWDRWQVVMSYYNNVWPLQELTGRTDHPGILKVPTKNCNIAVGAVKQAGLISPTSDIGQTDGPCPKTKECSTSRQSSCNK